MGTVYQVRDVALDRDVAMKVLAGVAEPDALTRLETEARILARLEHPGIVPVHDVGRLPDGRLYYVMKLVRGRRLDAVTTDASPVSERLRLLVRVAEAVAFAHAHGIVHRDLSPANIMIGPFGEVLVMDWGVALVRQLTQPDQPSQPAQRDGPGSTHNPTQPDRTRPNPTKPVQVVGTPGFMAPEQAHGTADERSDVFALGSLLVWLLDRGRGGPPRWPRALRSIAEKARAGDPSARYATADEVAADLARFLDGQPVRAHGESPLERAARFGRTYRVAILLVAGYLVMRVGLLLFRGI
jgi:serine/threonine protein kinase